MVKHEVMALATFVENKIGICGVAKVDVVGC
jgi:hypothetical protein